MTLLETLKAKLTECRRAGKPTEMAVLQVVLGDAGTAEARSGKKPTDDEVEKFIRKTMLANDETMALLLKRGDVAAHAKLVTENSLLKSLLPTTLSVAEIASELASIADTLKAAKGDGQATGAAMKHLKSKGLRVLGDDVAAAVKQVRA